MHSKWVAKERAGNVGAARSVSINGTMKLVALPNSALVASLTFERAHKASPALSVIALRMTSAVASDVTLAWDVAFGVDPALSVIAWLTGSAIASDVVLDVALDWDVACDVEVLSGWHLAWQSCSSGI
jgi:hypothetical protein